MTTLLLDEVTDINPKQQFEEMNRTEKTENISLICFDQNNELNDNTQNFKKQLDQINDHVEFHTELELCITFLQSLKNKVYLIISGSNASQILPHLTNFHQIDCIFVFSPRKDQYEYLSFESLKIVGIYDKVDLLCLSIQKQMDFIDKQIHTWCFFDQDEYATKDLSKQSSDFLWLQLFHDVLLHLPRDEQAKKQKIHPFCQSNIKEFALIDEFENEYQPNEAIRWFMKHSFYRKIINKALQTEDIDQLYILRHFLSDLVENLTYQHQQIVQSNREKLTLYRGMILSRDEFNQLQENKGKLISMKGFLTASIERSSTLAFLISSIKQTDFIPVLFEIECNLKELHDDFIFADVTQFNDIISQETILFDLNSTFRLENIQQDEQIWLIKLNAVNDGRIIKQKYIYDTHRQIENLSIPIIFGKLICDMSQWNQSQIYFQYLLNDQNNEDLAWIEHSIGQAHHWKGEWNEARKYYDSSYNRMIQTQPIRIKDSAVVLSNIGEILYLQGKYEEAYEFYQRALTIQKEYYSSDHVNIATSLANISLIYFRQRKYEEALAFLQQALTIREKYYNYFHVDIARGLIYIGCILTKQKKHDEALDHYQRAMSIYKKYYPLDHVYIAVALNNISDILVAQKKHDEALDMIRQALTIQKKFYQSVHIDIATSLANLANIKYEQKKYDESLQLYQQALTIQRKYYSDGHLELFYTLNNIGYVQLYGKKNSDEALHYHQQALTMLETYYPSYLAHIAFTLTYIGNTLSEQGKNDQALDFHRRALKMQKEYYSSDHIEMASVLGNIGRTLKDQGKYDEALDCYHRVVAIFKEFHPTNHTKIVINLGWIVFILYQKQSYDHAIEYLEKCLRIREASLSPGHLSIAENLSNLGQIQRIRHQYELSLAYELKCFLICERVLPPNHQDIGKSLSNIGKCYYQLNQRKLALDYYKRALLVYEQCSPSLQQDCYFLTLKIEKLSDEINNQI